MSIEAKFLSKALIEDVREFTDAIINDDRATNDELENIAKSLMSRHEIREDELINLVYGRLLLLARFCCCESQQETDSQPSIASITLLESDFKPDQFDGSIISDRHEFAETLFKEAFDHPRDARSGEYRQGVKAGIYSMFELAKVDCVYEAGTASFDAFFSGLSEGRNIARPYAASPAVSRRS